MDNPQPLPLWILPLFPLFFVVMWAGVLSLLSVLGGWAELARLYPDRGEVSAGAVRFGMTSGDLRRGPLPLPVNYGGCLKVAVAPEGVHLAVWVIFRVLHPPVFIPWTQIERVERGRSFFRDTVTLHPRGTGTRIRLYGAPARTVDEAARQLAARAGQPVSA